MLLYLIEIDENGNTIQLCTVDGNKEDFDPKKWKVFEDYKEANLAMGKRWNGSGWEELPKVEPQPPKPPKLSEAELGKLAIMEGIATNYEKMLSLEENQTAVMEGLASLYEGGIKNG